MILHSPSGEVSLPRSTQNVFVIGSFKKKVVEGQCSFFMREPHQQKTQVPLKSRILGKTVVSCL